MTNNDLSRKVLNLLNASESAVKFKAMLRELGVDPRMLFKNLFYLEEQKMVQLSTSYPTDAVYPQIHLIRLRGKGRELIQDQAALDEQFPLSDTSRDTSPHIPPDLRESRSVPYSKILEQLKNRVKQEDLDDDKKARLLQSINELMGLSLARKNMDV